MINALDKIEQRYKELNHLLAQPDILANQAEYKKITKEHFELSKTIEIYNSYKKVMRDIENNRYIAEDDEEEQELKDMAEEELNLLEAEKKRLEDTLKLCLAPKDPSDDKNIILEIRAGTGGEEASLFGADLFRMYCKFAEKNGWKVEVMLCSTTGKGGIKEVIATLSGSQVYRKMKYEIGTHRVQRIPETEASGRIHTSAATVAILPEAEEVDIEIDPNDLRIDVFRSSGHGGQSVNTTDSAVRITHIPTGLVVSMQDEKSQHKNKAKALKILRARLLDKVVAEQKNARSQDRKNQVGSGDRSERIRTYNFPQGRITDHRIGLTLYRLSSVMEGDLDEVVEKLALHFQAEAMDV